jgi:predicted DNA-binding protein (UPF0251 family)
MPRPGKFRRICQKPVANYYKPRGIPLSVLEHVNLTFDELEAIRLADLEGLYQEAASEQMNVSRQTFGRIIDSAHKKIADALVNGKALSIDGGKIEIDNSEINNRACGFRHRRCKHGRHGYRGDQHE